MKKGTVTLASNATSEGLCHSAKTDDQTVTLSWFVDEAASRPNNITFTFRKNETK